MNTYSLDYDLRDNGHSSSETDYPGSDMINYAGSQYDASKPINEERLEGKFVPFCLAMYQAKDTNAMNHVDEPLKEDNQANLASNFDTGVSTNYSDVPAKKDLMACESSDHDINPKLTSDILESPEEDSKIDENEVQEPPQNNTQEEEEIIGGKYENNQSIYKNKYKELLEQAKAIKDELMNWKRFKPLEVSEEARKSIEIWNYEAEKHAKDFNDYQEKEKALGKAQELFEAIEGDIKRAKSIVNDIKKAEAELKDLKKKVPNGEKEKKKFRKNIEKTENLLKQLQEEKEALDKRLPLAKAQKDAKKEGQKNASKALEGPKTKLQEFLKDKKSCLFLPIYEQKEEILKYVSKEEDTKFFNRYKAKRSMKYFEDYMQDEELYYWIIMLKMVLVLIPKDQKCLKLLPLQKETVPFMFWMIDSTIMKVKHKTLFKESYVRNHLRDEFTRVFKILYTSAAKKQANGEWTSEKWNSLHKVLDAMEGDNSSLPLVKESLSSPMISNCSTYSESGEESLKRQFNDFDLFDAESPMPEKKVCV